MNLPAGSKSMGLELPEPDAVAVEHSNRLAEKIISRIQHGNGVIGFDEYMQSILYEAGLGYYSAGSTKFGAAGDFVTAPEISALFGRCLAAQCASLFGQGCAARLLEFGAGSGRLCAHILQSAAQIENYYILDVSAELKARQRQYLEQQLPAELFHKIEWLTDLPKAFDGILLANEVLDAMPVHILLKQGRWSELGVGYDGERFDWRAFACDSPAVAAIEHIESRLGDLAEGYRSEVNLNYQPWLAALSQSCNRVVVLIIDYGYEQAQYYHPQRTSGSLTCHYQHRVHADPLVYPGLQDVTAFVDFDALADAAENNDFAIVGLVSQAEFLLANGLLEIAQKQVENTDSAEQVAISQQVKTLTLPAQMGEKFKVLALQKNIELAMPAMRRGVRLG